MGCGEAIIALYGLLRANFGVSVCGLGAVDSNLNLVWRFGVDFAAIRAAGADLIPEPIERQPKMRTRASTLCGECGEGLIVATR
ncbi:hypothetical protein ADT71_09410 [Novosphingobium sp. ST904]|nr:hypothetical protein ADT71_09410 [Novosphingobium sp. ST904]